MASKKIQLYTDRANTIEASPETSANCVILSDGNDLQKVLDNDLTTPTVVHEETSFKVGVGDVNVSSSVVDGEVGRMVVKGKTYQNILPEPSTPVLTNNKEMFKVNEGLDPNVEVVDGISKSAILKGQTLVNLFEEVERQTEVDKAYRFFKVIGNQVPTLKPNTKYTLIFDKYVEGVSTVIYKTHSASLMTDFYTFGKSFCFTTIEDVGTEFHIFIKGNTVEIAEQMLKLNPKIVILEGDYTNVNIPYFEGMKSVKMPVLTTTGKNLANSKMEMGNIRSSDGTLYDSNAHIRTKDYIPINPSINTVTLSNNKGYIGVVFEYDKDYKFIKYTTGKSDTTIATLNDDCRFIKFRTTDSSNATDLTALFQLEEGSIATSYEPYKSNILTIDGEYGSVGDIEDIIDLTTGKATIRTRQTTVTSENVKYNWSNDTHTCFYISQNDMINGYGKTVKSNLFLSGNINEVGSKELVTSDGTKNIMFSILNTRLSSNDLTGVIKFLEANELNVRYLLATESVKTVDLSSSGNWEKVVLNGSENWRTDGQTDYNFKAQTVLPYARQMFTNHKNFKNWTEYSSANGYEISCHGGNIGTAPNYTGSYFNLSIPKNIITSIADLKTHLSRNPITVWYQTTTHQDSTQVKQPIFFKDGHIQLSSGADNSLIPTLDYQAKTSNSYVMDLMKTNTRYTMKAKSASGTFTIDGTSYGAGTNGTFTTPTSMTNKLLVMSNKTNTEVMILEGDVVSKTIPHFKGIKSAFEDESKIEVLSTGKNLFDGVFEQGYLRDATGQPVDNNQNNYEGVHSVNYIPIKENTIYSLSVVLGSEYNGYNTSFYFYDENKNYLGYVANANKARSKENAKYMRFRIFKNGGSITKEHCNSDLNVKFQVEEGSVITTHEPYRSNNTKIPLLSPLRSLPNGVCDELIIDRMKKKATLIQRVGEQVYNGKNGNWTTEYQDNPILNVYDGDSSGKNKYGDTALMCNRFLPSGSNNRLNTKKYMLTPTGMSHFKFWVDTTLVISQWQSWLAKNPTTVLYRLATPVVTEIDLENFPLVYKDGHIFLNSEIAPVVEIDYSINQSQQIKSNNETLQRHELDILDLDNLIVSFVNAEYNLRLLKFDMELSMMALDE